MGLPNLVGLENKATAAGIDPKNLINSNSTNTNTGTGTIKRKRDGGRCGSPAWSRRCLPNGNLVVAARQEVRVNSELRDLQVTGIVRPQDIASDNTVVTRDRMAEARIIYGGRGTLTDLQTPRLRPTDNGRVAAVLATPPPAPSLKGYAGDGRGSPSYARSKTTQSSRCTRSMRSCRS